MSNKGTVLLVTLWILAILALLAIGIGFRTSVELKLVGYQADALKANELAKAGIMKAIVALEHDESSEIDTLWECGITLKETDTFDDQFGNVKLGEGRFETVIEDLQGKININTAPKNVLVSLSPDMTGEIADNIIAWRGSSQQGALLAQPGDYPDKPYGPKNAPFDAIGELMLVKDMTQEIYYGENGQSGVKDLLTVYGPAEFKVNVNTADRRTLEILFAAFDLNVTYAESIVKYRAGEDGDIKNAVDNNFFKDIPQVGEFLDSAAGGEIDDAILANLSKLLTCGSGYFQVRCAGVLDAKKPGIRKTITCFIKRETSAAPPHKTEIIGWAED